ncbi:colanic acid biosynthesis glycosyltransferase WcaA [Enterobacter roggenkampii]|nr:colanic acid biosynthesis glycosyltransferase WcaA [Enterobacter roggenkampii]QMR82717.1 colanic acid biosynthesis glycosyltransferase WcaA [Enterobacter roggenkampii]
MKGGYCYRMIRTLNSMPNFLIGIRLSMDRKNKLKKLIQYHKNILKNHRYQPGLAGADLRFMDLRGLYLRNINLSGCDISFCDLRGADFSCANLAGANLSYCKTEGTIFSHADCTCVDFTGSDIHDVRLLTEHEQNESDTPLSRPLISIYMPTWNRQALTIRAIQSVLNQDYVNWELIIIDDFSSSFDQLLTYISELNDPRITYIRNEFNSGACAVRNQAIRMARGDLITGLDDDEWLPTRLSSFLTWQHKLQLHSFLYANDYLCDGTGYHHPDELQVYPKPAYKKSLFDKRNIIGNQMLTLTSRMQQILFDDALPAAQDYDAFYRLAETFGEPFKLDDITQVLYVNHGEARITCSGRKFSGYLGFYRKHKAKLDVSSKKYQLFTLYYIRNKKMRPQTLMKLMTLRNLKRYLMMYTRFRNKKF